MGGARGTWTLDDLQIELFPAMPPDAVRGESVSQLRRLLSDFRYRDPRARRLLLDVHARLHGTRTPSGGLDLDTGDPRADAVGQQLLRAAQGGQLVLRRRPARSVIVRLDQASQEPLGPAPSSQDVGDQKSWIGIVLLDQTGAPVPGLRYRIIDTDGNVNDGTLDANGTAMIRELDPGNCQIFVPYVEAHPELSHVVAEGEHISGIAQSYGLFDYSLVWNHPDNADLRSQRPDPHVLQPGDVLAIPPVDATPRADKPTGAKHPFTLQTSPLKLRIKLLDLLVKPMTGVQVTVGGLPVTSDGDGLVEAPVDKAAQDVPFDLNGGEWDLHPGALNPSDDTSERGYIARLFNMGFLWDRDAMDGDAEMTIALQDFQAQYQLPLSGQLDDATKAKLKEAYGA
jgi:N-acetylmuramoyl-L-alanine amidase